jgi:geranylgeranyl diphosphate synthase, type II
MDFSTKLNSLVAQAEAGLDQYLPPAGTRPTRLHTAMRYSLQSGGKRLRPVLVLAAAELGGGSAGPAVPAAVAVECVHTYSLIHDDLPCMDDDDLRRGRPTAHRQFDEATALLAGDALLTHAFSLLSRAYADQPAVANQLVQTLSQAAGSERLIGGQMEDLLAEKQPDTSAEELEFIHRNKTGAMIEASLRLGGLVAGLEAADLQALETAGSHLGIAFQIADDVLDATADTATLGKTAGKDARAGKTTYVSLHGVERSRHLITRHTAAALEALARFGERGAFLAWLAESLVARRR